jgi:phenol/toluene 2-monooxygenase (NADH) P0/A0
MHSHPHPSAPAVRAFDVTQRYVRFRQQRDDGFVEFDFSIGDPALSVELVMPWQAYERFCMANSVTHLSDEEGRALDAEQLKWRYGHPGVTG